MRNIGFTNFEVLFFAIVGLVWQAQGRNDEFLLFAIRNAPALDRRPQPVTGAQLASKALVEVPLGTVLLEEIAFRAVLFSMLARRFGLVWGIVLSSLLATVLLVARPSAAAIARRRGL